MWVCVFALKEARKLVSCVWLTCGVLSHWGSALLQAAMWMAVGSVLSFLGIVHTYTLTDEGVTVNVEVPSHGNLQLRFGCVYAAVAVLLLGLHFRESEGLLSEIVASLKRRLVTALR